MPSLHEIAELFTAALPLLTPFLPYIAKRLFERKKPEPKPKPKRKRQRPRRQADPPWPGSFHSKPGKRRSGLAGRWNWPVCSPCAHKDGPVYTAGPPL
jgi:hypothetical protein